MGYQQSFNDRIHEAIYLKQQLLDQEAFFNKLSGIIETSVHSLQNDGKLLFCGNGGSAADAQHLAAELTGRFYIDRKPLHAEALHTNTSAITACANDYGYDHTFSRLLEAKGRKGDVLFALSTSGRSTSILNTVEKANQLNITTVGLSGQGTSRLDDLCDYLIHVPSTNTPRIQETHIFIGHIICEFIESEFFNTP